ncbi:MAG: cytochrome b N-terminal domain-containing protein [Chloroflexi bacterium]|nr:cytochrome b N-terminal domain-containing protein [Chloroflexota bacterium]MDA8188146.1 cytochrome b N-terminal domain-containing protein [Dehalococcoidales bacterium]
MLDRAYQWIDDRLGIDPIIRDVVDHPVPEHVNPAIHPRSIVYCFGGLTFFIFTLLITTGIFLTMYYVPTPDHAYDSVRYITDELTLGSIVRGIHHWSASGIVIMVVLHMLRVYAQGAYKAPREMNWMVGVGLLMVVMGFGFTGYLLPWDQKAYWATTVGTKMASQVPVVGHYLLLILRGGEDLGAVTLARFYSFHIWFLPGAAVTLLGLHFLMVRRQGISGPL